MNPSTQKILLFLMLLIGVFATWLIFWPVYEAWEAQALEPIANKIYDIVIGIVILGFDYHYGLKII
jgi:hypothetical protein